MKFYDNALLISHNLGVVDYGAGDSVQLIPAPPGCTRARIEGVLLDCDETFNTDTTEGGVQIGDGTDPDKFFTCSVGALAVNTAASFAGATSGYPTVDMDRDGNAGAAMTFLTVTMVAPTGGTPAGIANTTVVIHWF